MCVCVGGVCVCVGVCVCERYRDNSKIRRHTRGSLSIQKNSPQQLFAFDETSCTAECFDH